VLEQLGAAGPEWTAYDDAFGHQLLPPLIALMVARLVLFAIVAVRRRSSSALDYLRSALWVCFVALLWWAILRWRIFASGGPDFVLKTWLGIFLFINSIQIPLSLRRQWLSVKLPAVATGTRGHAHE
jgi:hypothetical protein